MRKIRIIGGLLLVGVLLVMAGSVSWAERLLTEEQALKEMLPGMDRIEKVTKLLTDEQVTRIKGRIKTMVLHQEGSEAKKMAENREYDFYFGIKDNKRVSVAIFDVQPGKWGPVNFVLSLDAATGNVKNMAVTAYVEKRGRPIALRSFLSQFFGKSSADQIEMGKDLRAISGATISSRSAAFVVRKTITLYEEVFIKAPLVERLKETNPVIRMQVVSELQKLEQGEKDKLLQQLVEQLAKKETTECEKEMIVAVLNAYSKPEMTKKLQETKIPAGTSLTGDLETILVKVVEMANIKLVWLPEQLRESAKQVKINEAVKISDADNIHTVLDNVITHYGCVKCRAPKDTNSTTYLLNLNGDSIEITSLENAQAHWQDWWENHTLNNGKETVK